MLVTVLMGVHNNVDSVRSAIESIRQQSYLDWEFFIVDDASTDGTRTVLKRLAGEEPRITLVRNSVNRGLAASLNRGWRMAKGDLIARMDADDESLPDRLQLQVEFMGSHPEVAVLGGGAELIDETGCRLGLALRPEHHEELVRRILKENPLIHPTVMLRRAFLKTMGGYDDRLRRAQDYDLWLRAYRQFRFHNLQRPLIRFRVPRSIPLQSILWGTFVRGRTARRERRPLTCGWCAPQHHS